MPRHLGSLCDASAAALITIPLLWACGDGVRNHEVPGADIKALGYNTLLPPSCEGSDDFNLSKAGLSPIDISFEKEMLINDLGVVNDPCRTQWTGTYVNAAGKTLNCPPETTGVWTAGYAFWHMAGKLGSNVNDNSTKLFVKELFLSWLKPQSVNGQSVAERTGIYTRLIMPWYRASTGTAAPSDYTMLDWMLLDMTKIPLRLLAIVNRLDMSFSEGSGGGYATGMGRGHPGEGRLIFGAVDMAGFEGPEKAPKLNTTVILEYSMPGASDGTDAKFVARSWHKLSGKSFSYIAPSIGDPLADYNTTLQILTDEFIRSKGPTGSEPVRDNGSHVLQVRFNDLAGHPDMPARIWELREYHMSRAPSDLITVGGKKIYPLRITTLKQTPDPAKANGTKDLCDFVLQQRQSIVLERHIVPEALLGGAAHVDSLDKSTFFWTLANCPRLYPSDWPRDPTENFSLQHRFAVGTCNGCHYQETATPQFHVFPRDWNEFASLSSFLTTRLYSGASFIVVFDPTQPEKVEKFNEPYRRSCELRRVMVGRRGSAWSTPSGGASH